MEKVCESFRRDTEREKSKSEYFLMWFDRKIIELILEDDGVRRHD